MSSHLKSKPGSSNSYKVRRDRDMDFVARENQKLSEFPEWSQKFPGNKRASEIEEERKVHNETFVVMTEMGDD